MRRPYHAGPSRGTAFLGLWGVFLGHSLAGIFAFGWMSQSAIRCPIDASACTLRNEYCKRRHLRWRRLRIDRLWCRRFVDQASNDGSLRGSTRTCPSTPKVLRSEPRPLSVPAACGVFAASRGRAHFEGVIMHPEVGPIGRPGELDRNPPVAHHLARSIGRPGPRADCSRGVSQRARAVVENATMPSRNA